MPEAVALIVVLHMVRLKEVCSVKKFLCFAIVCTMLALACAPAIADYSPIRFGTGKDRIVEDDPGFDTPAYRIKDKADYRVKDKDHYFEVTVDKVDCNYDISADEPDAWIVNIDLTWDGMNGVPRTKTMLRLFGDDLAQTIFKEFSDLNISQLWCRWAVPYLYDDDGFIAKYQYKQMDDTVYMTDSNGLLFNMPDNYK